MGGRHRRRDDEGPGTRDDARRQPNRGHVQGVQPNHEPPAEINTEQSTRGREPTSSSKPTSRMATRSASISSSPTISHLQAILCGVLLSITLFCASYRRSAPSLQTSDVITPGIKAYIDRAIAKSTRDLVGRRDFALFADGGRVIPELTSTIDDVSQPEMAISDNMRIGQCWLIVGSAGQLGLQLSEMLHPTHVSIDHIPLEIAADIARAPRSMILWGAVDGMRNESILRTLNTSLVADGPAAPRVGYGHTYTRLASFEYDIRASNHVQTFSIEQHIIQSGLYFGVMVLEIMGNWGATHTCLYRVRVHGEPVHIDL